MACLDSESTVASVVVSDSDASPVVSDSVAAIELGFSAVILGLGLIAGLILSKILNWWKW